MPGCKISSDDTVTKKTITDLQKLFDDFISKTREPESVFLDEISKKSKEFTENFRFDQQTENFFTDLKEKRIQWLGKDRGGEYIRVTSKEPHASIRIYYDNSRKKWSVLLTSITKYPMVSRENIDSKKVIENVCNEIDLIRVLVEKIKKGSMESYNSPMTTDDIASWLFTSS